MRLLFDLIGAQTEGSRLRGIGRYTRALALEMQRQCGDDDLAFSLSANFPDAANDLRAELAALAPQTAFHAYATRHAPAYGSPQTDPARRLGEAMFRRAVARAAPEAILASSVFEAWPKDFALFDFARLPVRIGACIVYDFIPAIFRDLYLQDRKQRKFYDEQMRATASADLMLAISESTRADTIRLLNVDPDRVVNISGAADPSFSPRAQDGAADDRLRTLGLTKPFVFCASGDDPRKNVMAAIDAIALLDPQTRANRQIALLVPFSDERRKLVRDRLAKAGFVESDVVFLDRIGDDDLALLCSRCELFLFPSLYEGFGLPALEAMQCGAAVLVGDNSSQREIVDRADLRCDAKSPQAFAEAMTRLLRDADHLADARRWGLSRAKDFTWAATARRTFDALHQADERTRTIARARPLPASLRLAEGLEAEAADILRAMPAQARNADAIADDILQTCPELYDGARRLLVDVTTIVAKDDRTGIQRVVRNIATALYRENDLDGVTPVAVRLDNGRLISCERYIARETGATQTVPDAEIEIARGDRLLMLDSSWKDFERFREVFARVRAADGEVVTCIYDLIPQLYKGASVGRVPEIHLAWLKAALLESDGMIAISRTVADELCDYVAQHALPTRPGLRVGWFHCGSDVAPAGAGAASDRIAQAFDEREKTFLLVGTIEPRKGHAIALEAFDALWRAGRNERLALIGRRGWHVDTLIEDIRAHPEFGKRLFWFENADDSDLAQAYGRCTAVLAPAYAEGFGLPLAEAAWRGKPVICSDIPVFREVGGAGAVYFRVNDPQALAAAVVDFVEGRATADPALVVKPTWREAALRIVDVVMHGQWTRTLPQ